MSLDFYQGGSFWKVPSEYKPGVPLTDQRITEVEQLLGVSLPKAYLRYMLEQNGGELAYRYVLFEDGEAAIIPYLYEMDTASGVGMSPLFLEQFGLPAGLVLLTGDFDSWLALDYRQQTEPEVIYLTNEGDLVSAQWKEYRLAPNFEEFTAKLFRRSPLKEEKKGGTAE
ncbi:SMI1/KNR4 family protein [Alkalihalobacillus oceani]|uniref:SMI1/KNR4 family protein n=1 Tax=Halalkalibacter oceani TaxID=1653776 RepID=A0A9X2INE5_9BACI|nr:SMI1/KNR4 family protein [Halalkalibacter oceani]MCM3713706.1 SMI1/KNR4 family protein [Halalkalibacter oceani]